MPLRLNPYLNFPGTAREAMTHYRSVFGGELEIHTFGDYGDPSAPYADGVMHARLETPDGFTIMASDLPPGMEPPPERGRVSVSLSGDDGAKLRAWWAGLSEGGDVTMPLQRQVWGDEFGMCVDRFGITWLVNITTLVE
ncbi:MAG: VOC family protein [Acidimicrobiales bacterium]|nr:MAG: VOC family protein [Acidimicrobiales bacterium]